MKERDPADLVMKCDGASNCLGLATRGLRLIVPPIAGLPATPDYRAVRMMTTLHLCDRHAAAGVITAAQLLGPREKRNMEEHARGARGLGFKLDFERARIEYVLTTTPEYRDFLASLGIERHVVAA